MTCTDVLGIIKECGIQGVSEFEYGDLRLMFKTDQSSRVDLGIEAPYTISNGDTVPVATEHDNDVEDVDIDVDDLLFTDPEAWDEYARNDK